jgi:hypothetical protein
MNMLPDIRELHGVFINPSEANCSIYESGRMIYKCLSHSKKYSLDYLEIDENKRNITNEYDFYAFNYHFITMGWLDTKYIRHLPGLKITFVLETLPNNPFVLCPSDDFDVYCTLDPTMKVADRRVYAFSRPLEVPAKLKPYCDSAIPVIGSFGFATTGKGFELVVDAVNKEFEEAVVRINIPSGTYTDEALWKLHKCNYADYLSDLCKKVAKKGVEVIITQDYMTKDELIEWCGQNTLNCFMYNRIMPGLSATTDQAISSGRPLAVSTNETFRHIHTYTKPYPFRTLKESIVLSQPEVLQMQRDWSPENFKIKFEKVLQDFSVYGKTDQNRMPLKTIRLKKKFSLPSKNIRIISGLPVKVREKISSFVKPYEKDPSCQIQAKRSFTDDGKEIILIISHKEEQCGIHQYALNITEALQKSTRYCFNYAECSNEEELKNVLAMTNPVAIIYNYYPATMPWLTSRVTKGISVPQLGIMHEVTQEEADKADREMFDFHLCPDPTLIENNPIVFKTKRLIPSYLNTKVIPETVTIGSFGFGFRDKGFERIIEIVQEEFDYAKIFLHIPFNDIVDIKGRMHASSTTKRCKGLITKPGIELVISHKFLNKQQLLDFLAGNTLNAFFYETNKNRGISSTIEHALAVQRPIAITKCGMFRHVLTATPSICIEDSSLQQIIDNGIAPLVPFYNDWSEAAFIKDYEQIISTILSV